MKQPTQHQKIINLCKDENWHCGNEFRNLFIFSPHKRRSEIAEEGKFYFIDQPCVHGHKNVLDYKMKLNTDKWRKVIYTVKELNKVVETFELI